MSRPSDEYRQKMQGLATRAAASIEAVLTPTQRKQLPGAMREIGALQTAGIPSATLRELKLTSTQKSRIEALAENFQKELAARAQAANGDFRSIMPAMLQLCDKTRANASDLLTPAQKAVVEKYGKDHPRRGVGGFGGAGRGPGGPHSP